MSAYCQMSDILGEIQMADLIALTDDAPVTGQVNVTILNQVIANASGLIDQYIASVYQLPLASWPAAVTSMAVTIACYRLYRRRQTPDEQNKFFGPYKDAVEFLKTVQEHKGILDLNTPQAYSGGASVGRRGVYSRWGMGSSTL